MKTLFTANQAVTLGAEPKQVVMDMRDLDETTLIMLEHALHTLGISKYVELEFNDEHAFLRIFELEEDERLKLAQFIVDSINQLTRKHGSLGLSLE